MVDVLPGSHNDSSSNPENCCPEHLSLKQEQAKSFPYECPTSTITKLSPRAGQGQPLAADEENTYQPLIPPRFAAVGDDKSEYQSLTLKTHMLPAKFSVSPTRPVPPAIPTKPKAV